MPTVIPVLEAHFPAAWPRNFPRCARAGAVLGSRHVGNQTYRYPISRKEPSK